MAVWIFATKQTLQTIEANCHLWYCEILLTRHWGVTAVFSYLTDVTAAKHYSRAVSTVLMSPDSRQQPKQESLFLSAATAAKNNSTRQIQLTRTERVGPAYRTHGTHCRLIRVEQAVPDTSRRSVYSWILSSFFNLNRNPLCSCATHTHSGSLSIPAAPAGLCTSEESHLQLFDSRDLHVGRAVVVRTSWFVGLSLWLTFICLSLFSHSVLSC